MKNLFRHFTNKKVVLILQERMGSTRLPGKALMGIDGEPKIDLMLKRIQRAKMVDKIVVALPVSSENDIMENHLTRNFPGIVIFRGKEHDVLTRVYGAAVYNQADYIVDLTADCPFVDPLYIDYFVSILKEGTYDYVSNIAVREWPDGFDIQVYTKDILESLFFTVNEMNFRQHTGYNYLRDPGKVSQWLGRPVRQFYEYPSPEYRRNNVGSWRLTLDTVEDLEVLRIVAKHFREKGRKYSARYQEIMDFVLEYKHILEINKHIVAKKPGE